MREIEPDVEFVLDPSDGGMLATTVDLLEDFWADFLLFRREALLSARKGDTLQTHRYLRSSLFIFLNYLAGQANRWEVFCARDQPTPQGRQSIVDRLARFSDEFSLTSFPRSDLEFLTALAGRCSNLIPSDEKELFRDLAFDRVESALIGVMTWVQDFVNKSGFPLHANTRSLFKPFKEHFGGPSREDYHEFDAYEDDPLAFQDPPGTWEEYKTGPAETPGVD